MLWSLPFIAYKYHLLYSKVYEKGVKASKPDIEWQRHVEF